MNSRAKKSLGQHFLKNRAAVETIIDALDISGGDTIIEIGPGAGALTLPLLQRSNGNHITKPWLNSVIGPSPKEKECGIRSIEYDSKNKKCDAHESCLLNSESIRVIAIEKDERLSTHSHKNLLGVPDEKFRYRWGMRPPPCFESFSQAVRLFRSQSHE